MRITHDSDYNYSLPEGLIAHEPSDPRDSSRLFVYSTTTNEIVLDSFANIARFLQPDSVIVLNDTKVVPARLRLNRITGGMIRVLFLVNEWDGGDIIKGLPDKAVRPGEALFLDQRPIVEAISHQNEEFTFKLQIPPAEFEKLTETRGETPLPPYIKSSLDEHALRERYQTTFASQPASVAAPTASLHFTDQVFASLSEKGIQPAYVTLHAGRGTFAPPNAAMESAAALHSEPIHVSRKTSDLIIAAKKRHSPVIAAGTTTTRALESAPDMILSGVGYHGQTTLFIKPPYDFKIVDGLITNFHLPGTSLIMMVDAFLRFKSAKRSWRDLYTAAIHEKFRFYSFGDAMLII